MRLAGKKAKHAMMDLDNMSAEDQARVVKIQALARGKIARKEAAKRAKKLKKERAAAAAAARQALAEEGYSEEDVQKIIKIQAAGRARIAHKKVAKVSLRRYRSG